MDNVESLGRYVLLRELGRGAIGIVYAAYHEGLDRKLAIKVLNRARAGQRDFEIRLRREARALARLSHPNVVQVYDVGEIDGRVFVVMEFVEGRTLGEWTREGHGLDEVLAMFVQAGRGLAAAHAAGVVHRDFKPDNVIVGSDGRPRVLDFGLARAIEGDVARTGDEASAVAASVDGGADGGDSEVASAEPVADSDAPMRGRARELANSRDAGELAHDERTRDGAGPDEGEEFDVTVESVVGEAVDPDAAILTRTGARVGTPAYMSPEQFLAKDVDQASDQFSFCVALHEAVYGRRPFPARHQSDLMAQVLSGRVIDAPPDSPVPAWLRAVVLRGLRPRAEERWPSMNELLDALEHQPPEDRGHRRWTIGLALAGVALVAAVVALVTPRVEAKCLNPAAARELLWTSEDAAALAGAFAGSGSSYASAAWTSVGPRLDAWADAWASAHAAVCEAGRAGEVGSSLLDRRAACLDRNRRAFAALVEQFREADRAMVEGAAEAVAALPEPARCSELAPSSAALIEPPAERAAEVAELRSELAELDTRAATGRSASALPLARALVERARASAYGPVVAEALLTHGRLLAHSDEAGGVDEALALLQDALDQADRSGHFEAIPSIATELVSLSIYARPDPMRGRLWARRARAGLDRLAQVEGREQRLAVMRARSSWALGNLDRLDGEFEQAERHIRDALALLDAHAPSHPERGVMLNDLGIVLAMRGDEDGARAAYEQAIRACTSAFGAGHPRIGNAHFNLARLEAAGGELQRAREQADLAFIIFVAARGQAHRDVGAVEILRASIALHEQQLDVARERAGRAKAIYDLVLAPDHIDRAEPDQMLGHAAFMAGDLDAAMVAYRTALSIKRAALPGDHPELVSTLTNLGLVHLERAKQLEARGEGAAADREAAVELLGQALAVLSRGEGVDPQQLQLSRSYYEAALGE